jgi:membrane protease YdiL (CAAX protease family)
VRPAPGDTHFTPAAAFGVWVVAFLVGAAGVVLADALTGFPITVVVEGADGTRETTTASPLWLNAVLLLPLWIPLLGGTLLVTTRLGSGDLRRDLGLRFRTWDLVGLPLGVATQLALVPALYALLDLIGLDTSSLDEPARHLTRQADGVGWALLLFVMVGLGAPIIEELFFRGLLMRSLQARWNDTLALVVSSVFFGVVHLQPLQMPGLILFGLVAGFCAQRTGRLGMSILAHISFNTTTVVLLLTG